MALAEIKNHLVVDERLATAGQPTEAQLGEVAASGTSGVVNLGLLDPKYCLADEAGVVAALGMTYRHIPVKFDAPAVDDFRTFVAVMDAWADRRVLAHCAANYRVSAFVALWGELRRGWTRARADAHACTFWEPNETWQAFMAACRAQMVDVDGGGRP
jgi:protein tyrosine phosphatase (PTP) superfamily phosphohydrolase (DUF442 family)